MVVCPLINSRSAKPSLLEGVGGNCFREHSTTGITMLDTVFAFPHGSFRCFHFRFIDDGAGSKTSGVYTHDVRRIPSRKPKGTNRPV